MAMLPPCRLNVIRDFLASRNYHKIDSLCNSKIEYWASEDNFNLVRFPISEDPMYFGNVVALLEYQMRCSLSDMPFYAKEIAQRFDAEGRYTGN